MRSSVLLAALFAAGCDGVFTHPGSAPADGPHEVDAPADAGADADAVAGDAAPDAAPLALHRYVISGERLPGRLAKAQMLGLDLDGDAVIDNKFGDVMRLIAEQGYEPSVVAMKAVREGDVLLLAELAADSFTAGPATFTLYTGDNPRPTPCGITGVDFMCGNHLHGGAMFDLDPATARYPPLAGTLVDGQLVTGVTAPAGDAGKLRLKVTFFEIPVTLELVAARVKVSSPDDDGIADGVLAGALSREAVSGLIPEIANALNATVLSECTGFPGWPDCGCKSGTGAKLLAQFDANHDCRIRGVGPDKVLLVQLFAPDLANGTLVSFGIGFTAVRATYTP